MGQIWWIYGFICFLLNWFCLYWWAIITWDVIFCCEILILILIVILVRTFPVLLDKNGKLLRALPAFVARHFCLVWFVEDSHRTNAHICFSFSGRRNCSRVCNWTNFLRWSSFFVISVTNLRVQYNGMLIWKWEDGSDGEAFGSREFLTKCNGYVDMCSSCFVWVSMSYTCLLLIKRKEEGYL